MYMDRNMDGNMDGNMDRNMDGNMDGNMNRNIDGNMDGTNIHENMNTNMNIHTNPDLHTNTLMFLKWTPSIKDSFYEKSKKDQKHKVIGNNVMETILQEGQEFINKHDSREKQFSQLNDREMVAQTNMNPFFSSNYLEDLKVQEQFLTPQNSNFYSDYKNK